MKEQFVPYEIAILLKEKGFTDECMASYQISLTAQENEEDGFSGSFGWEKGEVNFNKGYFVNCAPYCDFSNKSWLSCAAPLWQQVIDWLREKHSVDIMIRQTELKGRSYYKITKIETEDKIKGYSNFCKSTYEARQAAIEHALTLI